jgi:hypothetical protein
MRPSDSRVLVAERTAGRAPGKILLPGVAVGVDNHHTDPLNSPSDPIFL